MSVHAGSARPQRMSMGAAMLRVFVTLVLFFVVFIPFLIAPLLALGAGYLVYVVWRSRGSRPSSTSTAPGDPAAPSASGFGAGAR
jgi:threonine/homoserine/homoserine lactone efflux protein